MPGIMGEPTCIQGFGIMLGVIGSIPVYCTVLWSCAWDRRDHTCIHGFGIMPGIIGSIPVNRELELCLGS